MNLNNFDMEDSVKERLMFFLKYLNLGQTAFENKVGWSRGYISKVKGSIGSDMLANLVENYPELNVDWLLTGKGGMLKSKISIGDINNNRGNISGNVATSGGHVINIPNFNGQKIIEPSGKVEICGDTQSAVEKLEVENNSLKNEIALLREMINMKDKLILMLENNFKNCE